MKQLYFPEIVATFLSGILDVMVQCDVYSMAYDYQNGKQQLAWFQKLVTLLLNLEEKYVKFILQTVISGTV